MALGKLVHLGIRRTPTRSTLAYANAHRPWQLYETLFYQVLTRCQAMAASKRRRFRFKHPLRTLDTTIIELCAAVFDWARFQRTKGAIKLHLQLDHRGCLPCWTLIDVGFVTRPRTNMLYEVLVRRPVPARGPVLTDEVIRLTGLHAADRCPCGKSLSGMNGSSNGSPS
jgi:hypothetical protein